MTTTIEAINRDRQRQLTTPDGFTLWGCERDGYHVIDPLNRVVATYRGTEDISAALRTFRREHEDVKERDELTEQSNDPLTQ